MSFAVPVQERYLEDYIPGSVHTYGSLKIEEADILRFAREFDPQVLHADPEGARDTIFGGLIASGWHTASIMMRLFVDHYLSHCASLSSPGVDELRWLVPVRPGDELSLRVTVSSTRRSRSKPDRGILHSLIEMLNQEGQVVMRMKAMNLLRCKEIPATLKT
jgi:acyl dehydratase